MGARLRVFLTQKQDKTLLNLRRAKVPQKVKYPCSVTKPQSIIEQNLSNLSGVYG